MWCPCWMKQDNLPALVRADQAGVGGAVRATRSSSSTTAARTASFRILKDLHASDPRVRVIRFRRNFGQTAALSAGLRARQGRCGRRDGRRSAERSGGYPDARRQARRGLRRGQRLAEETPGQGPDPPAAFEDRQLADLAGSRRSSCTTTAARSRPTAGRSWPRRGSTARCTGSSRPWPVGAGRRSRSAWSTTGPERPGKAKYGLGRTVKVVLDLMTVKFLGSFSTKPIYVFGGLGLFTALMAILCRLARDLPEAGSARRT